MEYINNGYGENGASSSRPNHSSLMISERETRQQHEVLLSVEGVPEEEAQNLTRMGSTGIKSTIINQTLQQQQGTKVPQVNPHDINEQTIPIRTALEPSGYYAGSRVIKEETQRDSGPTRITPADSINSKEVQREDANISNRMGHNDKSPNVCDDDQGSRSVNINDENKPHWSTKSLKLPFFPRKRRSPGDRNSTSSNQMAVRLPSFSSYNNQWTSILESNKKHNINSSQNKMIEYDQKIPSRSYNSISVSNNDDAYSIKRDIIKKKTHEDFLSTITKHDDNQGIDIQNDTSVTGRYNTMRKYEPFGFEASTAKACKGEQYEVFQSPASQCYQYFETNFLNSEGCDTNDDSSLGQRIGNHQHYQSWDPKTMQYSSQPEQFQSLSRLPLTSSSSAAAESRAALLSLMKPANIDDGSSAGTDCKQPETISSSIVIGVNEVTEDTQFRGDSEGDGFGRRHSLYLPSDPTTKSFEVTRSDNSNDLFNNNAAESSARSARNLRRSFQNYLHQGRANLVDQFGLNSNKTSIDATEDLFQMSSVENPNFLKDFQGDSWTNTTGSNITRRRRQQLGQQEQQYDQNKTYSSGKRKKRNGTPCRKRGRKKQDPSLRRSSRKKSRHCSDEDSSSSYSDDD